jgi:predicted XRE-type DNA-binding protein
MRVKTVSNSEHGPRHVTPAGRSVFHDLFPAEKAAELHMRAQLLMALERWLKKSRLTQSEVAKVLRISKDRVLIWNEARLIAFAWTFWCG